MGKPTNRSFLQEMKTNINDSGTDQRGVQTARSWDQRQTQQGEDLTGQSEQETEIRRDGGQHRETGREVPEDAAWHGADSYHGADASPVPCPLCVGGQA